MGLDNELPTSHIAYCDDITLVAHTVKNLQQTLASTSKWLRRFGLVVNPKKTAATSNTNCNFSLNVEDISIPSSNKPFKFLGVWIDPHLDWTRAIKAATGSFVSKLNKVKYKRLPFKVKSTVVNIMCNKALEYVTAFTGLPLSKANRIAKEAATMVKRSIPVRSTASTKWVFASKRVGGMGIEHASTGTKVALVSTFLRVLRDTAPSPATAALRIRVKENTFLKNLGRRNFNINNERWARTSLPLYSNDNWTTKYVKIMEQHDLITVNNILDTSLVVDGISYMSRKTWLAAGISLDTPWSDLFQDRAPKSRKQLWKEGFKLTLNEYMNTVAMVTTEGALAEHLNKVLAATEAPISFDPRNKQLDQFHIEGNIFKNTIVFTDGSAKDQEAGWGVYFKKGSKFNAYGKVVGFPNNFVAELEAIEYAICIAPTTPFLTVFTDSEAAIKAIKAARVATPRGLARMPAKDTIARILRAIGERETLGGEVSLLHVYSHQQQKLASNPTKWEPLIKQSNFKLSQSFPDLDYVRGNEEADSLAEKGRMLSCRPDIIPKGLEDFVVLPANSKVPLEDSHIWQGIRTKDNREWDRKAQALVHKEKRKWWTNKVSHQALADPETGTWLRRARLHNRTTTTLLHQNTNNATAPKLARVNQATTNNLCPMSGCACKDTQDHIFYCKHSRQHLAKLTNRINTIAEQSSTGLSIEAYWIPGIDRRPPSNTKKSPPKLKWGSLGLVPKATWTHLVSVLGEQKAREVALKINQEIVSTLFRLDKKRTSRIKMIMSPDPGIPRDVWNPH